MRHTKKGIRFLWGPEQRRAFEELKHRLTSAPVLAYPDFSPCAGTFVLDTDASQRLGIGAVLSQVQSDGTERVVAYGSRSLNEHERNYCTTRLEMLALVTYVDHFRYYLAGCKFLLRTDHHSLKWLMSFREPEGQIARWLEPLQEYDFEVECRPGKSHCNADAMSRKPRRFHGDCPSCGQTGLLRTRVSTLAHDHAKEEEEVNLGNPWSSNAISQAQRKDPDIGPVLEQYLRERKKPSMHELQSLSSTSRAVWAQCELMEVVDGVLCIRSEKSSSPQKHRVVLPGSLIQPALKECHDALAGGHFGREKTLQKMKIRFWRPNLSRSVKEYCNDCLTCAKSKPRRKP